MGNQLFMVRGELNFLSILFTNASAFQVVGGFFFKVKCVSSTLNTKKKCFNVIIGVSSRWVSYLWPQRKNKFKSSFFL